MANGGIVRVGRADLRIQKTYDALIAAFEALLQDADAYSTLNCPDIMVQFLIGGMNQITEWWFSQRGTIDQDAVLADTKVLVSGMLQ